MEFDNTNHPTKWRRNTFSFINHGICLCILFWGETWCNSILLFYDVIHMIWYYYCVPYARYRLICLKVIIICTQSFIYFSWTHIQCLEMQTYRTCKQVFFYINCFICTDDAIFCWFVPYTLLCIGYIHMKLLWTFFIAAVMLWFSVQLIFIMCDFCQLFSICVFCRISLHVRHGITYDHTSDIISTNNNLSYHKDNVFLRLYCHRQGKSSIIVMFVTVYAIS